jgi:hypothetical protein
MHYDCIEFKGFYEPPRQLKELEELCHTLLSVRCEDSQCIAVFPNGDFALPLELRDELESLVGREIAILRLGGRYYLREVVAGA